MGFWMAILFQICLSIHLIGGVYFSLLCINKARSEPVYHRPCADCEFKTLYPAVSWVLAVEPCISGLADACSWSSSASQPCCGSQTIGVAASSRGSRWGRDGVARRLVSRLIRLPFYPVFPGSCLASIGISAARHPALLSLLNSN